MGTRTLGKRVKFEDIASRPGAGCSVGLALSLRATAKRDFDLYELLYIIAPRVLGEPMAETARELFDVIGHTPFRPYLADDFALREGDPFAHPKHNAFEPDNLRPEDSNYGDSDTLGAGASYAKL